MLLKRFGRSLTVSLAALFMINSVAPVVAQPEVQLVPDPSIPPPRTESSYHPEANARRLLSNPYKVWPIQNDSPYYVRESPHMVPYECNESISKYPEAIPKPEEEMTCPPNEYPQKFLFERPMIDTPLAPQPDSSGQFKLEPSIKPQSSTGI